MRALLRCETRALEQAALPLPCTPPRSAAVDVPASVTKSPGPASSAHARSPISRQLHVASLVAGSAALPPPVAGGGGSTACAQQQQQQHTAVVAGVVTQRRDTSSAAAGPPGTAPCLPSHHTREQQQQHHHHYHHYSKPPGGGHGSERFARQARLHMLRRGATWLCLVGGALLLLGVLVPGSSPPAGGPGSGAAAAGSPLEDVRLDLGPYFFNPSIVRHRGVYLATARTAHMKRVDRTNWWFNEAYVCLSTRHDFETTSCRKFDPWQGCVFVFLCVCQFVCVCVLLLRMKRGLTLLGLGCLVLSLAVASMCIPLHPHLLTASPSHNQQQHLTPCDLWFIRLCCNNAGASRSACGAASARWRTWTRRAWRTQSCLCGLGAVCMPCLAASQRRWVPVHTVGTPCLCSLWCRWVLYS